jgi:hypothetical protein
MTRADALAIRDFGGRVHGADFNPLAFARTLDPQALRLRRAAARILKDEPTDYWLLRGADELEATYNIAGRRHAILRGGAVVTTDGLRMDGEDDYVIVPFDPALNPAEFTLEMWVRIGTQDVSVHPLVRSQALKSPDRPIDVHGYQMDYTRWSGWSFRTGADDQWEASDAVHEADEQWVHVAFTFRATVAGSAYRLSEGTRRIYVNGRQVKSEPGRYRPYQTDLFVIGRDAPGEMFFNGTMRDVILFDRALSPDEIREHYEILRSDHSSDA